LSNIERLTDLEVKEIQGFLEERYKVEVIEASLAELKKKGLYNTEKMGLEDGVLLKIEKINFKWFNTVHFDFKVSLCQRSHWSRDYHTF
jgi:hypothetical protein